MFRTFKIFIGLCLEFWKNKNLCNHTKAEWCLANIDKHFVKFQVVSYTKGVGATWNFNSLFPVWSLWLEDVTAHGRQFPGSKLELFTMSTGCSVGQHDGLQQTEGLINSLLTYWGLDKMAAIFQTTFSNSFSCMKIIVLWFRFHWNLFPNGPINNNGRCHGQQIPPVWWSVRQNW